MRRRKNAIVSAPPERSNFMTLFTSLSVILLAFFILLSTLAVLDDAKKRKALGSLRGSFGILTGGMVFDEEGKFLERRKHITDDIVLFERMRRDMEVVVSARHLGQQGDVKLDKGGVHPRLTISSRILYPEGGASLSPKAFPLLDRLADAAGQLDRALVIEGHTADPGLELGQPGEPQWEVSAARAVQVQRYLTNAAHMAPERVEAEGAAHFRPEAGLPARDRVVIVFRDISDRRKGGALP